jgi:hypothetical protein
LPERYQGLGVSQTSRCMLSPKNHFLQRKWDGNDSTSKVAGTIYEAFIVEVGMYGNIFSRSWEEFNSLATKHTWYYNLWELCDRLGVELEVNEKYHNKPVRQGDRSVIDVAIEKGYRDKTLESINVVRKYLNLMHLSDLVHCDGRTLSEDLLEASGWLATKVTFPKEKITRNDKSLWGQFLDTLTDGCNTLLEPLGEYISPPHTKLHCQYDQASTPLL